MHKKRDIIIILEILIVAVFIMWLIMRPHDKVAQVGFAFNNTKLSCLKFLNKSDATEYLFHRNNAVYLAKMDRQTAALREMDMAVSSYPIFLPDSGLYTLYKDRAQMKLYYKDYKGALDDLCRIPQPSYSDKLKIALLFKQAGKNSQALTYCNDILESDIKAYAGYACIADVYASVGKYEASVAVMDLLIDRSPNRGKYYAERAKYKEKLGDLNGAQNDLDRAYELAPMLNIGPSLTDEILNPKVLQLTVS